MAYKPKKLKKTFVYNEPLTAAGIRAKGRREHARAVAVREDTESRLASGKSSIDWDAIEASNHGIKRAAK